MKKGVLILAAVLLIAFATVWMAGAQEKADASKMDAAFVTAKCNTCHNMERTCSKIGKKNAAQWERTIVRMVSKGTALTEAEQKEMIGFLSGLKAPADLCP